MFAYCLYKKQKREFIVKYNLKYDDPRVRSYHHDLNTDRISTLMVAAKARLQIYANEIEEAVIENDRVEAYNSTIVAELGRTIKNETAAWKAILYSGTGAFLVGIIIIFANRMGFMNPFDVLDKPK